MATLTEVSVVARKGIKIFFAGLVVLIISPYILRAVRDLYLRLNPPPPEPANIKYGMIPKIEFPEMVLEATPEYKLETISGGLPTMPKIGKIYLVGINKYRLLTLDRIKQRVMRLGFSNEPQEMNDKLYRFYHPKIPAILTYNILSNEFTYQYDWTQDPAVPVSTSIPTGNNAITTAKNFFTKLESLPEDLNSGQGRYSYFKVDANSMTPVINVYEANFVRVDLFRAKKDDLVIATPGGNTSPVSIILSGVPGEKQVVLASYQYSQVVDNDFGTYPLKPIENAWQELIEGKGYVVNIEDYKVTIRNISMGYYESHIPQKFLQLVYIFDGDKNFKAYVPAVDLNQLQAE